MHLLVCVCVCFFYSNTQCDHVQVQQQTIILNQIDLKFYLFIFNDMVLEFIYLFK